MANYQSTHTGAEIDAGIDLLDKNNATNGQVLTANGIGGASWQNASGGTTVEANPTLSGTEADLTGLSVNGTKYKVPSGGSGGGTQLYLHQITITTGDPELYVFISKSQTIITSYADFETFILSGDWQFIYGHRNHANETISINVRLATGGAGKEAVLNSIGITEYNGTFVYTEDILAGLRSAIDYSDEVTPL